MIYIWLKQMFFIPLQPNITNINMAKALIIGREREQDELRRLTESSSSEFVAVYGRRRVGKTYLVKEFYNQQFDFYATGICRGNRRDQIKSFNDSLVEYGSTDKSAPKDWFEAFNRLKSIVANSSTNCHGWTLQNRISFRLLTCFGTNGAPHAMI